MKRAIAHCVLFACVAPAVFAQEPNEQPPVLRASQILKREMSAGPHFRVRESVPTLTGANRFVINSDFGTFEAEGNHMLEVRVAEIAALAKLKEISRSDEYEKALEKAARSPITFAENLVKDPGKTVTDVPKGALKLIGRIGEGVKGAVEGRGGSAGDAATSAIGMQSVKRQLAVELGVDPYSTNQVLQAELDSVAWASFAGGATIKVLLLPLSGGVVTAAKIASSGSEIQDMLRESSPSDLSLANREKLAAMGIPKETVEAFLGNPAISPTRQTLLTAALGRLEGVKDRTAYVRGAGQLAEDEHDAVFWHLTAKMLAGIHERRPLDRLVLLEGGFPLAIAKDGTVVVALHWDYACWTVLAERFAGEIRRLGSGDKPAYSVSLSGTASPRLRQELEARGFAVEDRLVPGPLK